MRTDETRKKVRIVRARPARIRTKLAYWRSSSVQDAGKHGRNGSEKLISPCRGEINTDETRKRVKIVRAARHLLGIDKAPEQAYSRSELRGRVKFPTGGTAREPSHAARQIWCDSIADSKVWMREEVIRQDCFI